MDTNKENIRSFLSDLMKRKKLCSSRLAAELNVSHATVSRWFNGKASLSTKSCRKLAELAGVSEEYILVIAGHLQKKDPTIAPEPIEYLNAYLRPDGRRLPLNIQEAIDGLAVALQGVKTLINAC